MRSFEIERTAVTWRSWIELRGNQPWKPPAGLGSEEFHQFLVDVADPRGHVPLGGIGGFLVSREKHARHVTLIAVHGDSAVDENVLEAECADGEFARRPD